MIEPDSTPIDLIYDELLRQLTSMENAAVGNTQRMMAIELVTDTVIDLMGKKINFRKAAAELVRHIDCAIYRSVVLEGIERSIALNEANHYWVSESDDRPCVRFINQAKTMLLKARDLALFEDMLKTTEFLADSESKRFLNRELKDAQNVGRELDVSVDGLCSISTDVNYRAALLSVVEMSVPIVFWEHFYRLGNPQGAYAVLNSARRRMANECVSVRPADVCRAA